MNRGVPNSMPDISRLTREEQDVIENVMQRQQQEEAYDRQMISKLQDDVVKIQNNVRQAPSTSTAGGGPSMCAICRKTKFAEGGGHSCKFCQVRSCARCGYRVQTKAGASWCCLLCKKKQQLLFKGSQWHGQNNAVSTDNLLRMEQQQQQLPTNERRHRSVGDNLDLVEQDSNHPRHAYPPLEDNRYPSSQNLEMRRIAEEPYHHQLPPLRDPREPDNIPPPGEDPTFFVHQSDDSPSHTSERYYAGSEVDYYDRERRPGYDNRQAPPPDTRRGEFRGADDDYYNQGYRGERNYIYVSSPNSSYPELFDGPRRPAYQRDVPYRSDDDRSWRIPEIYDEPHHYHSDNPNSHPPPSQPPVLYNDSQAPPPPNRRFLDPKLASSRTARQRRFIESMRADSLSSDPSDTTRPPPPRARRGKRNNHYKQSISSSEDDLRSTPDYTSEDVEENRDFDSRDPYDSSRAYPRRGELYEGHSSDASTSSSSRRRMLPQVPLEIQQSTRDKVTRELEQKTHQLKIRMQQQQGYGTNIPDIMVDSENDPSRRYRGPSGEPNQRSVRIDDPMAPSRMNHDDKGAERSHRTLSEFKTQMEDRTRKPDKDPVTAPPPQVPAKTKAEMVAANRRAHDARKQAARERQASLSDSATTRPDKKIKRKPSLGKIGKVMGWKTGADDKKKGFQRSEEVGINRLESTDSSLGSASATMETPNSDFSGFVEGLGPGQIVGRQVLGAACLGEIQLSLFDRKGRLDIEVVRARRLLCKPGAKVLPATYVKIYLVEGKRCVEKLRTSSVRNTLDPFYSQSIHFVEPFGGGRMIQVTVWGDYGRMDKKVFMGVAQIELKKLSLSQTVIGWYKLFPSNSLTSGAQATLFSHSGSSSSIDGHASH